jgi:hypothetical protein
VRELATNRDLCGTANELLSYEWLPIEGRDFLVRLERAAVNGVSIEYEVFYSTAPT